MNKTNRDFGAIVPGRKVVRNGQTLVCLEADRGQILFQIEGQDRYGRMGATAWRALED